MQIPVEALGACLPVKAIPHFSADKFIAFCLSFVEEECAPAYALLLMRQYFAKCPERQPDPLVDPLLSSNDAYFIVLVVCLMLASELLDDQVWQRAELVHPLELDPKQTGRLRNEILSASDYTIPQKDEMAATTAYLDRLAQYKSY